MKTPKQLEEWSFSTNNSEKNKIGDGAPVEEENFTEKCGNILETSSSIEDGLSTTCSTFCTSQNTNERLKQLMKKLEIKMETKNLALEKSDFELEKEIQKLNSKHENEIRNLQQTFHQLTQENNKRLKAEYDEKINSLEEDNKKKIQNLNCDNENKIEELKQHFQKLIEEKFKQLIDGNDVCLKQKDKNTNSLEDESKKNFVNLENKLSEIDTNITKCCDNECINTNNPVGNCIKGFGYGNLINDQNIKYVLTNGGKLLNFNVFYIFLGCNKVFAVYGKNSFNNPQNCSNYSIYYFEIKCKFEANINTAGKWVNIGLKNFNTAKRIYYSAYKHKIVNEKDEFQLSTPFNNNDLFGCGIAYPSINMTNKFPYVFFTQNGKQIGKGILLKEKFGSYKPYIWLICCSVEVNFGNDLEAKPFNYDILEHSILKEFY